MSKKIPDGMANSSGLTTRVACGPLALFFTNIAPKLFLMLCVKNNLSCQKTRRKTNPFMNGNLSRVVNSNLVSCI